MASIHHVIYNNIKIEYNLERKNVKNTNLRIKSNGKIYVSANKKIKVSQINEFILNKALKIIAILQKISEQQKIQPKSYITGETFKILGKPYQLEITKGKKNSVYLKNDIICLCLKNIDDFNYRKKMFDKFFTELAKAVFEEIANEIFIRFKDYNIKMPKISVRKMKSYWGSCAYLNGKITLNTYLLQASKKCIEFVILHEFCHFIQPNHSPKFYNILSYFMPNWKIYKEQLNKNVQLNYQ